jgi:sugar lactone lactonase YvrE
VRRKWLIRTLRQAATPSFIVATLAIACLVPSSLCGQYTITTVAGNGTSVGPSSDGSQARIVAITPFGIAVDRLGNLYIADKGSANTNGPRPSASRKVDTNGVITTVGCDGAPGLGVPPTPDSAPAHSVSCGNLTGTTVDILGDVFITEGGGRDLDVITTSDIASIVTEQLNGPANIVGDSPNALFLADTGNCRIVEANISGALVPLAGRTGSCGFSGDGGTATAAQLNFPTGVAVDSFGNLYIADTDNLRIRKVDTFGVITTVAGNGTGCNSGPNDTPIDNVPAVDSGVCPSSVAVDAAGNLYIADFNSGRIRKVDTSGTITTIAGGGTNGLGDGGPATSAQLQFPSDVVVDSSGKIYVSDSGDYRVRLLTPAAVIIKNLSISTSGFLFSRVTHLFTGTLLITNTGNQPTPGSLQLVFTDLAAGVSLERASGLFNGSPFITLPAATTLSPGQSVAVSVQFSDPANSRITFTPVVYSGSL